MSRTVTIAGGGIAGCAAALSALQCGAAVSIFDPAKGPKHKVCGEFLSPEVYEALRRIGAEGKFEALAPAAIRRMSLTFGSRRRESRLPEPAFGLSRYRFDAMLRQCALHAGALHISTRAEAATDIAAIGRRAPAAGRHRLFGFKAHFTGPANDAVELYFFNGYYVGVNPVEGGRTNVCGIGPEQGIRAIREDFAAFARASPALLERIQPLQREMEWLITGPLVFGPQTPPASGLAAGDALRFIDPFTGSGMLNALLSGALAGRTVAMQRPSTEYEKQADALQRQPYLIASLFRAAINSGIAEWIVPYVPGALLFSATRPRKEKGR